MRVSNYTTVEMKLSTSAEDTWMAHSSYSNNYTNKRHSWATNRIESEKQITFSWQVHHQRKRTLVNCLQRTHFHWFRDEVFENYKINSISTLTNRSFNICSSWSLFDNEITFLRNISKQFLKQYAQSIFKYVLPSHLLSSWDTKNIKCHTFHI